MEALWRREEDGTLALVIGGTTLLTAEDILSLSLLFVIACKADVLEKKTNESNRMFSLQNYREKTKEWGILLIVNKNFIPHKIYILVPKVL